MGRTKVQEAGTVASTGRLPNESDETYVARLATFGTAAAVTVMETVTLAADDAARLATFEGRVRLSFMAGKAAIAKATVALGAAPADYAAVAKACEVSADGGTYLGRKYSTLKECYRVANDHTAALCETFTATYREAMGRNPEQIRQYVQWLAAAKSGKAASMNTVAKLQARAATADANSTKAAAKAADDAKLAADLVTAGVVKGCALTAAQWRGMDEDTLHAVALLAAKLASAKGKVRRDAERAAKANETAAETGPTPRRRTRTAVAS